jgi:hypothetical protein
LATALQFTLNTPIAIAGKLLVNTFDLLTQRFVLVIATLSMLLVGLVVKRAGGEAGYLAGFRN